MSLNLQESSCSTEKMILIPSSVLVHPSALIDIAGQIRNHLIETSRLEKINAGRDSKKDRLYESFTRPEYCRDLQARMEAKAKLDELQVKEEENHRILWNKTNCCQN